MKILLLGQMKEQVTVLCCQSQLSSKIGMLAASTGVSCLPSPPASGLRRWGEMVLTPSSSVFAFPPPHSRCPQVPAESVPRGREKSTRQIPPPSDPLAASARPHKKVSALRVEFWSAVDCSEEVAVTCSAS